MLVSLKAQFSNIFHLPVSAGLFDCDGAIVQYVVIDPMAVTTSQHTLIIISTSSDTKLSAIHFFLQTIQTYNKYNDLAKSVRT